VLRTESPQTDFAARVFTARRHRKFKVI